MNVQVRYYTRTGNTKKLADIIAGAVNVKAEDVSVALSEKADILFLGCSYYAFDLDGEVKKFIRDNKDNIGKVVCFGTSALMNSMLKPLQKVTDEVGVELSTEEFHCWGSFGMLHKNHPDADDLKKAASFAKRIVEE